ncbi:MAG TPA: hypothetical protein EYP60_09865, partial [bacterium (Candidatus Stahlbacteria)]|nr:hypothetical protein [Candidatus Stahlbacteria bacterium]
MNPLIIIGNGEVEKDYSCFVDKADYVIRFNWLLNYNKNTGTKTNALVLASAKNHIYEYINPSLEAHKDRYQLLESTLNQVETLMFPIPDGNRGCTNRLSRIVSLVEHYSLQQKKVKIYFCEDRYLKMLEKHEWHKQCIAPSSGYTVIMNILDDSDFNDYDIYLLGFSWEGWQGHP